MCRVLICKLAAHMILFTSNNPAHFGPTSTEEFPCVTQVQVGCANATSPKIPMFDRFCLFTELGKTEILLNSKLHSGPKLSGHIQSAITTTQKLKSVLLSAVFICSNPCFVCEKGKPPPLEEGSLLWLPCLQKFALVRRAALCNNNNYVSKLPILRKGHHVSQPDLLHLSP